MILLRQHKFCTQNESTRSSNGTQSKNLEEENEVLKFTSKGKKVGHVGKVAHFMIGISYNKGVTVCEKYEKMNGKYMESFVERNFDRLFEISVGDKERCFLQDGDKNQNCANARKAWTEKFKAEMFSILPRIQDLNPIENIFHLVQIKWERKSLEDNLIKESFKEFIIRVKRTTLGLDIDVVNQTIKLLHKRLKDIIKSKGDRLKY